MRKGVLSVRYEPRSKWRKLIEKDPDYKFLRRQELKDIAEKILEQVAHPQLITLDYVDAKRIIESGKSLSVISFKLNNPESLLKDCRERLKDEKFKNAVVIVSGGGSMRLESVGEIMRVFVKKCEDLTTTANVNENLKGKEILVEAVLVK